MLARGEKTQEKIQIKLTADQNARTVVMRLLCEEMSFHKTSDAFLSKLTKQTNKQKTIISVCEGH